MATSKGTPSWMALPGDRAIDNELLGLPLSSESSTPTTAKWQTLDVWRRRPDAENHWFDCVVGCAVGASLEGVSPLSRIAAVKPPERKSINLNKVRRYKLR